MLCAPLLAPARLRAARQTFRIGTVALTGFTLAHLSDPHLAFGLKRSDVAKLTLKQILALSSWQRRRVHLHRMAALRAITDDMRLTHLCHVAVTGDLVNIADVSEFDSAAAWLEELGDCETISLVPGNHDRLRAHRPGSGIDLWAPWMRGDSGEAFPYLRRRGEVALIGVASGMLRPLLDAGGRVGSAQLERLARLLRLTAEEGSFRVVMIHHPPLIGPGGMRKALHDRAALCAVLAREGAELVLHGHHHITRRLDLPGPRGPIAVFGVPSASSLPRPHHHDEPAAWHLHHIARHAEGWQLRTEARAIDPATLRVGPAGAWETVLRR